MPDDVALAVEHRCSALHDDLIVAVSPFNVIKPFAAAAVENPRLSPQPAIALEAPLEQQRPISHTDLGQAGTRSDVGNRHTLIAKLYFHQRAIMVVLIDRAIACLGIRRCRNEQQKGKDWKKITLHCTPPQA